MESMHLAGQLPHGRLTNLIVAIPAITKEFPAFVAVLVEDERKELLPRAVTSPRLHLLAHVRRVVLLPRV